MKNKLTTLFMLFLLLIGVCACSQGGGEASQNGQQTESSVPEADPAKLDQVLLGVRLGMSQAEVEKALGQKGTWGEENSLCFYDFTILNFRFDRLQYWFEDGKLVSIEYWLEGTGTGNTKIQTRDFSKNVASVLGEPEESEITLAWFQKWTLDAHTKLSVGHNFGETYCTVSILPVEEE